MAKQLVAFDKFRIERFSDTLVAILVVSMTLNLRIPERLDDETTPVLAWHVVAYAMSFVVLGILWVNHRQISAALDSAPRGFQWLNLHLLFWMTLIPATTEHVAGHPTQPMALALYSGLLGAISMSFWLLRIVLARIAPQNPQLARINFGMAHRSLAAGLIYGAGAPLAFVTPYAAMTCLVAVPLMFFVPDTSLKDRL